MPIKITPEAVPDFADEKAWGKQILAAVKELKEKSPQAKAFFDAKWPYWPARVLLLANTFG